MSSWLVCFRCAVAPVVIRRDLTRLVEYDDFVLSPARRTVEVFWKPLNVHILCDDFLMLLLLVAY